MKRFLPIFLALAWLMALCCPGFAAVECTVPQSAANAVSFDVPTIGGGKGDTYATMGDLYQAWGGYEGYPDYICGVWSTDGSMDNLTVAVTDDAAGERGREEILSQLENPGTVTFTTQKYRYNELQAVMDEIVAQMGGDSPIIGCGVYEMENKVGVTLLETAETAEATAEELLKKHGDKITVELGSMIYETAIHRPRGVGLAVAGVVLLAVFGTVGLILARRRPMRAQVETAVAQRTETPPDRMEERIRE